MARGKGDSGLDGLAVVDKPAGWTSHDVVARCRKLLGTRKVGHSGTLDPDATGVLLVGAGRVTRLLRFLTDLPKAYTGVVVLGVATSTLDAAGEVTGEWDLSGVTDEQVRAAAARFVGDILQVPPMVSAVKVGGKRLHELAREGVEVEREARPVTVHAFEVGERVDVPAAAPGEGRPAFAVAVRCSSGTYVRTLAADLGEALGGGAHLRDLRRTAIGSFGLAEAVALDDVRPERLLSPAEALRDYPSATVDGDVATAVGHGKVLDRPSLGVGDDDAGPWAVLGPAGDLLAVYEAHRGSTVKPAVVVAPAG